MQNSFRKIFAPPIFPEDDDKTRAAAILNTIGWFVLLFIVGILFLRLILRNDVNLAEVNWILTAVIIVIAAVLYLSHRSFVRLASVLFVVTLWSGLSYVAWVADGIHDVAFFAYCLPILIAGLLIGWRSAIIATIFSILAGWGLAYAETLQLFAPTLDSPINFARDMTAIFALIGVLIYLTINGLQSTLAKSRTVTEELFTSNKDLDELRGNLQQQVEQRTSELRKRATQLEVVSGVARTIASMQDIDVLLPTITQLVSQQFGFYHVGIFLLDLQRQEAVLQAANSSGGLRMLSRHHVLALDSRSIVGYVASRGEPRIVLDVGTDSVYFNNPDLPNTRSEMAIPLRVAGTVIGVLDVQSTETHAFSQEDIGVLTTLADQVAIAIENARLFGETKKALSEARILFEKYTQQEWSSFARQAKPSGFVFDGKHVVALDGKSKRELIKTAYQTGNLSRAKTSAAIAVPIKLRGQTIGVLDIRAKHGQRAWKADEIAMLEAAAERAALALENTRLIDSAQRRAARERAIGDISTRIGAVSSLESILQTAVEELGRKIGGATEVTLEINTDDGQNSGL